MAAPATVHSNVTPVRIWEKKKKKNSKNTDLCADSRGYLGILLKLGLRGMCERGLSDQELIKAFAH